MNIAIIQNGEHFNFSSEHHFHKVIDLLNYLETDSPKERHDDEIPHFEWILSEIKEIADQLDVLLICNLLKDDSENFLSDKLAYRFSAFELALHVRLHEKKSVRNLPIVVLSFKSIEQIIDQCFDVPQILGTYGFFLANPNLISSVEVKTWATPIGDPIFKDDRFDNIKLKTIGQLIGDCSKKTIEENDSFVRKVYIVNTATSNHDIANEWGAYRMAEVAGLDMEEFSYPKTLYFKYLLSNYCDKEKPETSNCLPFHNKNLKVLFIDDYCDKEWDNCLKKVFDKKIILEGKGKSTFTTSVQWNDSYLNEIRDDEYDLILLDYYLSNNDKGLDKLKLIKLANPVIPIIMFTASNKAWSMDELYEAGADGYYVKEHPETAHDPEFSVKNFDNFHKTVKNCLEKGLLLRPYWRKIQEIKDNSISIINNKIDNNGNEQLTKERINERLVMFLGLLKKAFEQTEFDKSTFFYSEWELAFLTLWSTLNEIQEVYYEKIPVKHIDRNGIDYQVHDNHPDKPNLASINTWRLNTKIKKTFKNPIFIEYDLDFEYEASGQVKVKNGYYQIKSENKSIFYYNGSHKYEKYYSYNYKGISATKVNLEKILHSQIAFILLNMNAKNQLMRNLKHLNDFRNHLYLTHGEDSADADFTVLYQDQRKLDDDPDESDLKWKTHIQQLFEIVYFLCTGEECDWNN